MSEGGEWVAQLSDDLKGNEAFTSFETVSDFAKAHLETVGKVSELDGRATELEGEKTDLEGRLANSIPKLGEDATEEQILAYRVALGMPESPDDYEFPPTEGVEQSEEMINWARPLFHELGLTKAQASALSQSWDKLVLGMEKADVDEYTAALAESEKTLKAEWGTEYEGNKELVKRAFAFFDEKVPGFKDFVTVEKSKGTVLANHPILVKAFHIIGTAMAEDITPAGDPPKGDPKKEGILYDKSPVPPGAA